AEAAEGQDCGGQREGRGRVDHGKVKKLIPQGLNSCTKAHECARLNAKCAVFVLFSLSIGRKTVTLQAI
ncbi:MAG: hypothetical protein K2J86_08315, partial [Prevotella sp.]|nr:hypothetical protein [Prevotella sp.]